MLPIARMRPVPEHGNVLDVVAALTPVTLLNYVFMQPDLILPRSFVK